MIILYFFFFFYCYAAHRDLHSFPTRRSSDLWNRISAGSGLRSAGVCPPPRQRKANSPPKVNKRRSEEHTSELQSLRHLVCRLLLEKKKEVKCLGCHSDSKCYDSLGSGSPHKC